jgi:Ferritin-like domain
VSPATDRRAFLRGAGAGLASAGGVALVAACGGTASASFTLPPGVRGALTLQDRQILAGVQIAEALAVTTYSHIIDSAPFFRRLRPAFQHYLTAAREEEMSHYALEQAVTGRRASVTSFFFPPRMFQDAQTTLNVLVELEDAFIAAYLVGVRFFSTPDLRVTAARIAGVESEHRALARVIAPNVARVDQGPIASISGLQKKVEPVDPANNNAYERTLGLRPAGIAPALAAFTEAGAAASAGFDAKNPVTFKPFMPVAPEPLGDFHSLRG